MNIDSIAIPVYPLPSKPFAVQPPPKIPTGFAPFTSVDRNVSKVRKWRTAQREIRGIAGGRWFARSWVGEKDSEYSNSMAVAAEAAAAKLAQSESASASIPLIVPPAPPISAPLVSNAIMKPKPLKVQELASSEPSRAPSISSDTHAPHGPSKMRTMLLPGESEAGNDSELVVPMT